MNMKITLLYFQKIINTIFKIILFYQKIFNLKDGLTAIDLVFGNGDKEMIQFFRKIPEYAKFLRYED